MSTSEPQNSELKIPPWEPQPAGTRWIENQVQRFRQLNAVVTEFEQLLRVTTGGRLFDWIDHLQVTDAVGLQEAGFVPLSDGWYQHPHALLPSVRVGGSDELLLRVDSVIDFVAANVHRFDFTITGQPLDLWRTAIVKSGSSARFGVVERHGCNSLKPARTLSDLEKLQSAEVKELLRLRPRRFGDETEAFKSTRQLLQAVIEKVGPDLCCDLFFEAERNYWQARNRAGQVQYMRQNSLGLGWGNHDHHTYRSSRSSFIHLIEILELMGFRCREQFYAGAESGWGAQVLEQPTCGIVIFADVDLDAAEITGDIAHTPLPLRESLGTIGLWCALHGEAFFEAGMHHLECQFDFDCARSQLEQLGIRSMKPFTDFPWLRQCFTEAERWPVDRRRIQQLLDRELITPEQGLRFETEGAAGSHLEILERNDGYRGFNQTGINDIIRRTDPRFLVVQQ